MIAQVWVGSSCHLKCSQEAVQLFHNAIDQYHLHDKITLAGTFCIGKCNRFGVTVKIQDDIHIGITKEDF